MNDELFEIIQKVSDYSLSGQNQSDNPTQKAAR